LILDQIGFDYSRLKLAIIKQSRNRYVMEDFRKRFLTQIILTLIVGKQDTLSRKIIRCISTFLTITAMRQLNM
jgi:hypothetical protein